MQLLILHPILSDNLQQFLHLVYILKTVLFLAVIVTVEGCFFAEFVLHACSSTMRRFVLLVGLVVERDVPLGDQVLHLADCYVHLRD